MNKNIKNLRILQHHLMLIQKNVYRVHLFF